MNFNKLVNKAGWPSGPWAAEPDMRVFQVKRDEHVYTCALVRRHSDGLIMAHVMMSDGHPFSARSAVPNTSVTVASDCGLDLGFTYAHRIVHPSGSCAPRTYDPVYTYYGMDYFEDEAIKVIDKIAWMTRSATMAAQAPQENDVVFLEEEQEEEDEEEEEYEEEEEDN